MEGAEFSRKASSCKLKSTRSANRHTKPKSSEKLKLSSYAFTVSGTSSTGKSKFSKKPKSSSEPAVDEPRNSSSGKSKSFEKLKSPACAVSESETSSSSMSKSSEKPKSSSQPAVDEPRSSANGKSESLEKPKSSSCAVSESGSSAVGKTRLPKMPPSSYVPPSKQQRLETSFHEVEFRQRKEDPTWSMWFNQLAACKISHVC